MSERFYSKILLFGEYSIIKGGKGLAIPCSKFFGELQFSNNKLSQEYKLDDFATYLNGRGLLKKLLDTNRLLEDVKKGLYFHSNIPHGHGVGSSGALCASLFARYAYDFELNDAMLEKNLSFLQDAMSLMESFYHGTSSGLDCLISLVNRAVLINSRSEVQFCDPPALSHFGSFYLYDSGISRKTAPLVHEFLKDFHDDPNFRESFADFMNKSNSLILSFLNQEKTQFNENFKKISLLQFNFFEKMIPHHVKKFWLDGLKSESYYMKLCGAGGGGFFLVFTTDEKLTQNELIALN